MDFTQWISDPEKIGIVALLIIAVVVLFRGWIIPVGTHNTIIAGYTASAVDLKKQLDDAKADAKASRDELILLLKRQVELTQQTMAFAEQTRQQRREDKIGP